MSTTGSASGSRAPVDDYAARYRARDSGWSADNLVDREAEICRLRRAVSDLVRGRSGRIVITGRHGSGRSALLRVALSQAQSGGLPAVLARCSSAESDLRFGVVSQFVAGLAVSGYPLPSRPGDFDREPLSTAIPRLCSEFVAVARRNPLVLAADDLRWADLASKVWLGAITHRLHHAPILLIHTAVPSALGEDDPTGNWQATPAETDCQVIHARPLRESGVREMIAATTRGWVDAEFVAQATAASAGRPAILRAVLDQFATAGLPPSAEFAHRFAARAADLTGERAAEVISSLPQPASALLAAMTIGGNELSFDLVAEIAGLGAAAAARVLRVLDELGLVVDSEEPRLAGGVPASAALAGLDFRERRNLRARAVDLGYRAAVSADLLARLLVEAPPVGAGWAGDVLTRVGARRRIEGDRPAAIAMFTRALREPLGPRRREVLVELSMAEVHESPEAADRRLHRALLDPGTLEPDAALFSAADLLLSRGDTRSTYRTIATACARVSQDGADARSLAAIGLLAKNDGSDDRGLPVPPLPDLPPAPDDPIQAGVVAWQLATEGTGSGRARELARRALAQRGPFVPRLYAARVLLCGDDVAEAVIALEEILADARRQAVPTAAALALVQRGLCELRRGNLAQVDEDLQQAWAQLPSSSWHPRVIPGFVALEASLYLARGDLDHAEHVLRRDLPDGADQGVAWAYLSYVHGRLSMMLADPQAALKRFLVTGRMLLARRWTNPALSDWRSLAASAQVMCGETATAQRMIREAVDRARVWGARTPLGQAHLWASRILPETEATHELENAVEALRDSVARGAYVTALLELAKAKVRDEDHIAGERLLDEATAVPGITDSPDIVDHIREVTARLDLTATAGVHDGDRALTDEEERIAALAGGGRTNAEIAKYLSVSTRTVELRLTRIYRKLAVKGRAHLVERLQKVGTED